MTYMTNTDSAPTKPTRVADGEYVHYGFTIIRQPDRTWRVETEDGRNLGTGWNTLKGAARGIMEHIEYGAHKVH